MSVSFAPKPFEDKPDSGLHTNYSDLTIRAQQPTAVQSVLNNLAAYHQWTMASYGDNTKRITNADTFTYGVSDRTASVRIHPSG